jgi:ComF family protein
MIEASLRRTTGRLLDLVLPRRCIACGKGLAAGAQAGALCAGCWSAIDFLSPPLCERCGFPFEFELEAGAAALCVACRTAPPVFDRARAVMAYDAGSRAMLLAFKHADRTDLAPAFGRWLARAGGDLLAEADVVAPVPLHWTRLFARRYNQAALLAQAAARQAGRPFHPEILVRRRRTAPQSAGRAARARNVAGAFLVPPGRRPQVEGRRILLVDDVRTTGATLEACARALKAAGASGVDVLTLALVVRPRILRPGGTSHARRAR